MVGVRKMRSRCLGKCIENIQQWKNMHNLLDTGGFSIIQCHKQVSSFEFIKYGVCWPPLLFYGSLCLPSLSLRWSRKLNDYSPRSVSAVFHARGRHKIFATHDTKAVRK